MKGSSFTKAVALLSGIAFVCAAGTAHAALSKENTSCRSTVYKTSAKLNSTSWKAFGTCVKNSAKALSGNCSNAIATDAKVSAAAQKMHDAVGGVKTKCDDTVNAAALAEHEICSAPISDDDPVGTWAQVATCLEDLNDRTIQDLANAILSPSYSGIASADNPKNLAKCINTIAKGAAKLHATFGKNQGKAQVGCDGKDDSKGGNACNGLDYSQGGADPGGKIAAAVVKFEASLDKACGLKSGVPLLSDGDLARVGSCANTLAGMKTCIVNKVTANAEGLTAAAFDEPGTCPSQVLVTVRGGAVGGAIVRPTELDVGWKGLGHNAQVVDGFDGIVNLSCTDNTCSDCSVTAACDATLGNCRCSNDVTQKCSTPFVQDTCGGGNTCLLYFGPPLALSSSGTPVCVTNVIPNELDGTANLKTGESTTTVANTAKVHLGLGQANPCPTCNATTLKCEGGPRNGQTCHVDAVHPTFGPVSYDCPPDPTDNVSGAGLGITLPLTNATTSSLPFGTVCSAFGFGGFSCACAVCTGDTTVACNSNADCSGVGGTCTSQGSGVGSQPNNCNTLTCNDQGGGEGRCDVGPDQGFCDGLIRASGAGVITCGTNADCDALDPTCPNGDCGDCTLSERLPCFLDPIEATGTPGTEQSVLVSTFCSPPTNSSAVNGSAGTPGAGRAKLDFAFVGLCADGDIWGPGGANCQ